MAGNTKHACQSQLLHHYPASNFFLFLCLLAASLVLSVFFLYRLLTQTKRNVMTCPTVSYIVLAFCFQFLTSWHYSFELMFPSNAWGKPPLYCTTMFFLTNALGCLSYLQFLQVLLQRLKLTYAQSVYKVSKHVAKAWNTLIIVVLMYAMLFAFGIAVGFDCNKKTRLHGWVVAAGIFPQHALICGANRKNVAVWNSYATFYSTVPLFVIGSNILLAYMYVSRLILVFGPKENEKREMSSAAKIVVKKTMMVTLASVSTSCLALIMAAAGLEQCLCIDAFLNVFFLFCMFTFGKAMYVSTLGRFEWVLDSLMLKWSKAKEPKSPIFEPPKLVTVADRMSVGEELHQTGLAEDAQLDNEDEDAFQEEAYVEELDNEDEDSEDI